MSCSVQERHNRRACPDCEGLMSGRRFSHDYLVPSPGRRGRENPAYYCLLCRTVLVKHGDGAQAPALAQ